MNVLYKYCDTKVVEILKSLELKLPYVSQVNDPLECLPWFYCPDDKAAMKDQWLRTVDRNHINPPINWEQKLNEQFEKGEIQKNLVKAAQESVRALTGKSCLVSVSKTAQNAVVWAHYTERHKGGVIGIDFDNVIPNTIMAAGYLMRPVSYSEHRPKVNVLHEVSFKTTEKIIRTKSDAWVYEEEFRTIFPIDYLEELRSQGVACLKDLNHEATWFLRLNPQSIREVVFGLFTDEKLKADITKVLERPELRHVKLGQVEEAETYKLNVKYIL